MKSYPTTKTARACLLLGSIACLLTSSCAVSQKKAGERGSIIGALLGGAGGYAVGEQHGRTKGDAITGGVVGALGGAGVGQKIGEGSSTLDGLGDVILNP